jgi:hypothetical protein
MLGMHRFAAVQAGLLSIIAFSGASAADLALRTKTKAPPAVVATVYDWSQECHTVIRRAGVAVVRCRSAAGDAAVTGNKYFLLPRPFRSVCTWGGTSF